MNKKISIQGFEGSFHQEAAKQFFKDVEVICCSTFREVVKVAAGKKQSDGGVMAIENSIAGSILPNYNLLQKTNLKIIGEVYLQIKQNLLVNPGIKLEDIREVHSHPMALLQCIDYLEKNNWKLVETEDTALSAKYIHQHRHKHVAVVASSLAAELFNLDILAPGIQSVKNNYTRFLFVEPENNITGPADVNKASVHFQTDHAKGSLVKVLTKIAAADINLSKLQSLPIPEKQWKYSFHADMEFESREQFNQAFEEMKTVTASLQVLGIYKKGKTISK